MADWTPPAGDAAWSPPVSDSPPDADDRAAMGDPSDPYGGASTGAAEGFTSLVSGIPATIAGGVGYLAKSAKNLLHIGDGEDPLDTAHKVADKLTYAPRTKGGEAAVDTLQKGMALPGKGVQAAADVIDPTTNLGQTIRNVGERAMFATAPIAPLDAAASRVGRIGMKTEGQITRFGQPEDVPAPPKEAPGPVTAESLQAGPTRLPEAPSEAPATPAPKLKVRLKAGAAATATGAAEEAPKPPPAAPLSDEAEIASGGAPDKAAQDARSQAVQQLQEDTGAAMPNIRKSAVTGDFRETGTDYQLGELGHEGMRTQLDQEQHALKTASQQQIDRAGGTPGIRPGEKTINQQALEDRGTVIDRAVQGINGWFDKNISDLYQKADAAAGQKPMEKFDNFHQLLDDHSQFTGVEGRQLHGDIQQVAKQFGMMNEQGFWQPTSVATTEKFRQWLGEQYSPRTARVISRAKDALDSDVATHGGAGLYDEARALRFKKDQMLKGPGIEPLIPEKLPNGRISRSVDLHKIADHIVNRPREEFDHIVNVLHDSSKLGNGELAAGNAAAINELRQHMAERLHEAGANSEDKFWNSRAYHNKLDAYSTKVPALFAPEGVRRFNTIRDAGSALRVNKRYPGAAKQLMQAGGLGEGMRKRIASTVEGATLGWLGPFKSVLADASGLAGKMRETIEKKLPGGDNAERNAEMGEQRVQPLGQKMGGKQGGWIGNLQRSKLPPIDHKYDAQTGEHTVTSGNGFTNAIDGANGKDIMMNHTETTADARGSGEGTARMAKLADLAHERGGTLRSDKTVSALQQKSYGALAHMGYDVQLNPKAVRNPQTGGLMAQDGVFAVAPNRKPLGAIIGGGKQRGAVGDIYDRTPNKDVWGNERRVNDRLQQKEAPTNNPYDSGGGRTVGARAFVPKGQRGSVPNVGESPLLQALAKVAKTPQFKRWFGKSQVVDPASGSPQVVYHGTMNDFKSFDTERANIESDWGKGIYFTNDKDDLSHNYAGEGPDMRQKIDMRAEELQQKFRDDHGSNEPEPDYQQQARAEHAQHEGATIPSLLRMEKPAILGGKNETRFSHEYEYENPDDPESDITGEKGSLPAFTQALHDVASKYDEVDHEKLDHAISLMHEYGDGLKLSDALKHLTIDRDVGAAGALSYATDENGKIAGKEIIREALEKAGFDGVIDHTVTKKFHMAGMKPGTTHYIIFHPNQVKSAIGNSGSFSKSNTDITAKNQRDNNEQAA